MHAKFWSEGVKALLWKPPHTQEDKTKKPGYLTLLQPKCWVTDEAPNLKNRHVTTRYMIRAIQSHI